MESIESLIFSHILYIIYVPLGELQYFTYSNGSATKGDAFPIQKNMIPSAVAVGSFQFAQRNAYNQYHHFLASTTTCHNKR